LSKFTNRLQQLPKNVMVNFRFIRYLSVFTLPLSVFLSFSGNGLMTFFPVFFFFIVVPILELFFKPVKANLEGEKKDQIKNALIYDVLLYIILPIQFGFLWFFLGSIKREGLTWIEIAGMTTSMGMMCGVFGINIGHELGHRVNRYEKLVGELLLLSSLNTHFLPYHNLGHHKNVATPSDSATARKGEVVFLFWIRSNFTSYVQAWQIETKRLNKKGLPFISIHNRMLVYLIAQIGLIALIYFQFGFVGMVAFLGAAVFGVLLLETVNYIEHYGLLRKMNDKGVYERVKPWHSWNSDHIIGRVLLFELSRHSDHHYLASKKYQILDSYEESPQMPTGYPGMMMLALFPPLWFKIMNSKVDSIRKDH